MPPPTKVPLADHVVRYVSKQKQIRDLKDRLLGLHPEAFELTVKDGKPEEWLSTSWLEFFVDMPGMEQKAVCVVSAMNGTGFKVAKSAVLAVIRVQYLIEAGVRETLSLRVLHEPARGKGNPSYVTVRGYHVDCPKELLTALFFQGACVVLLEIGKLPESIAL